MIDTRLLTDGPLVSAILSTCGRADGLAAALRSVAAQSYGNLQILLAGADGRDLPGLVRSIDDERVVCLPPGVRPGRAAAINKAIRLAEGRYVCYLDEATIHYRDHVATLASALEAGDDCQVAYSDLYHTVRRPAGDGGGQVLAKLLAAGRDFDRFYLLHRNHVPLPALMHRRALLDRTGPFDERLERLADWDMVRRMAFYSDFRHVPTITGEIVSAGPTTTASKTGQPPCDGRLLAERHIVHARRPARPWPGMPDLAVIYTPRRADRTTAARITRIAQRTRYPYRLYPVAPPAGAASLDVGTDTTVVPAAPNCPRAARVDKALRLCDQVLVAVVPEDLPIGRDWVDSSVHALLSTPLPKQARLLKPAAAGIWGAVFRTAELRRARRRHPALSVRQSVEADGIAVRPPAPEEMPFRLDRAIRLGRAAEADGSFARAADLYEADGAFDGRPGDRLLTCEAAAGALWHDGGQDGRALELCRHVNDRRPTVASLLLEARLRRRSGQPERAVELLRRARGVLRKPHCREESPC